MASKVKLGELAIAVLGAVVSALVAAFYKIRATPSGGKCGLVLHRRGGARSLRAIS